MSKPRPAPLPARIAAIDIGTAKTVVLVGQVVDRRVRLLGFGERRTEGVVKGVVEDLQRLADGVHRAVADAEASAGVTLRDVYASVNGPQVDGERVKGILTVPGRERRVTAADFQDVVASARRIEPPPGRMTLLYMAQPTLLDGRPVANPVGMQGERLETSFWRVTHEESSLRQRVGSHASACAVAGEGDKRTGCLVLDLGAGTTSWILHYRDHILCAGCVPVGGEHVTNDLCSALRVRRDVAEDIKVKFASAVHRPDDANKTIVKEGLPGGDLQFNRATINLVASVRMGELLEQVRSDVAARLRQIFGREVDLSPAFLPSGLILTGGASQLADLPAAATAVFGLPARCASPATEAPDLRKPEYACVVGLVAAALVNEAPPRRRPAGWWESLRNLFRR